MSDVEEYLVGDGEEYGDGEGAEFGVPLPVPDRKHTVYGLPDHTEGQRVHVGTRREYIGNFPGWDYPQTIRENARARRYEWLMIEMREDGKVKGSPKAIHLRPRVETMELEAGARPAYQRPHYRRPLRRPHARRAPQDKSVELTREMVERLEKQHAAELARIEEHNRELRDMQRRHDEEVRRLEEKRQEEINKRLEEKISESRTKPEENPAGFDFKSFVGQALVKAVERGDDDLASNLVGTLKQDEEDAGSGWGFLRSVTGDLIEAVRENPQSIAQAAQALAPVISLFRGGAPILPPPQPGVAPPPQPPVGQPQPLSDLQVITVLSQEAAVAIVANSGPADIARLVRDVLTQRPHLRPTIEETFRQSDEELLVSLSAMTGVSFDGLGRTPLRWAKDFRKALLAFGVNATPQAEDEAAHAGNNGNLGAASVAAQ